MDQVEHLAAALNMVNASLFPKPTAEQKLKKFLVKTSTADIVEAEDEDDAIETAIQLQMASPDADYDVTEYKEPAVTHENGCAIVNPKANRYKEKPLDPDTIGCDKYHASKDDALTDTIFEHTNNEGYDLRALLDSSIELVVKDKEINNG